MTTPPPAGRFAPSPTGPLHMGSLLAAVGSYLDIKSQGGRWLVRMEDVDRNRNIEGADRRILDSLLAHGLQWDGEVLYQTHREQAYETALQQLFDTGRLFYCNCTRQQLRSRQTPYPGTCREHKSADYRPATRHDPASHAVRFEVGVEPITFVDGILGEQRFAPADAGDFVVRRRDSLFAYQLAVVVDDAWQGITQITRGADLLDSTPWQIELQRALQLPTPEYTHLPLLVHGDDGSKLSKQTAAKPLRYENASDNLLQTLRLLTVELPGEAKQWSAPEILAAAVNRWDRSKVATTAITVTN